MKEIAEERLDNYHFLRQSVAYHFKEKHREDSVGEKYRSCQPKPTRTFTEHQIQYNERFWFKSESVKKDLIRLEDYTGEHAVCRTFGCKREVYALTLETIRYPHLYVQTKGAALLTPCSDLIIRNRSV